MIYLFILSFIFAPFIVEAKTSKHSYHHSTLSDYEKNHYITSKEKSALSSYVLPIDHPIKPLLDAIFYTSRATASKTSLIEAGFKILKEQPRSFIYVVKHPSIPGYLFKLHTDDELREKKGKPGWHWFAKRISGAHAIARCIEKNNLQYVKVPNKWVYPLPEEPLAKDGKGSKRKNFILVVDDMQLLRRAPNEHAWKTSITKAHLNDLKRVIEKCGGSSFRAANLPISIDGKISFIDTEYPDKEPNYRQVDHMLNTDMRSYWRKITR